MRRALLGLVALASSGLGWAGPVDTSIDAILKDYFKIQTALAQDSTAGIDAAAKSILQTAKAVSASDTELRNLLGDIQTAAEAIQGKPLDGARSEFFGLSRPLLVYLHKHHSAKEGYFRFYCSMAKKGWIQAEKGTKNPYYGRSMLACGELIQ